MKKAAVCIIYDIKSKEILMLERKNKPLGWGLVGGKVEDGEDVFDATLREVKEETGIDIVWPMYLGSVESATGTYEMLVHHEFIKGKPEVTISSEHTGYKWVDPQNPEVELAGNTHLMLEMFNKIWKP